MPTSPAAHYVLLLSWLGSVCGCIVDNARHCPSDAVCAERAAAGAGEGPLCHPIGRFCYAGCKGDDDCTASDRPGYSPSTPRCNLASGHCEGEDGLRDNGAACDQATQCRSGVCSSGTCCDGVCGGPCRDCQSGSCRPRAAGTECGASSCDAGKLTLRRCTATGACAAQAVTCKGFDCADASSCKSSCADPADCVTGVFCVAKVCQGELDDGESCEGNGAACRSGNCVDGVCCASDGCPACQRCDLPGDPPGICRPRAAGPAPAGECPGDAACGADTCDGLGACGYAAAGAPCGPTSCSPAAPYEARQPQCDAQGHCSVIDITDCGFARCESGACFDGCATTADCIAASLCDRAEAHTHPAGRGRCVDPLEVVTVLGGETLADGVARSSSAKPYVAVPAGSYTSALTITGKRVKLIALDGSAPLLKPSANAAPAVSLLLNADLQLQGITIEGASGSGGKGIACSGSTLALLESTIRSNSEQGVDATNCSVTIRRCRIQANQGGGVRVQQGAVVITDSLIVGNGTQPGSPLGGLSIAPAGGAATLTNLTLAYNSAPNGAADGVSCASGTVLRNSILWFNGSKPYAGCSFNDSNVQGGAPGAGNIDGDPLFEAAVADNYHLKTGSPSIDAGDTAAAGVGTIDLDQGARVQNGKVDQGAYER